MKREKPYMYIESRDGRYYLSWSDGVEPFSDPMKRDEALQMLRRLQRVHALKAE